MRLSLRAVLLLSLSEEHLDIPALTIFAPMHTMIVE